MKINMRMGDIVFVSGNTLAASVIRKMDKMENGCDGKFSHVGVAITKDKMVDAQYNKRASVVDINELIVTGRVRDVEVVSICDNQDIRLAMSNNAMALVGAKYDYLQLLSYVTERYFGWKLKNDEHRLICSELVANALVSTGIVDWKSSSEIERIKNATPNELYEFLLSKQLKCKKKRVV